jgi:NADPH:quinone reductase-like Zn-dependent oxidoreductase
MALETKPSREDLASVAELIEAGQVVPAIDRCYPLEEVPEAFRYIEAGHARSKVVIGIAG